MRRLTAVLAVLVAVAAGVLPVVADPAPAPASAATAAQMLASFDPGDIISDQVMFNSGTMTAAAVQTFLNGQVPTCRSGYTCLKGYHQTTPSRAGDPMCRAYTGASNESAATIIVKVAKACGVNPQVLLVVLQKEQSLVTDTWPSTSQYTKATGYACPDTAPCSAEYNGFFNQVYKAAWALVRYTMPTGTGPGTDYYTNYGAMYAVGKRSALLYNPDTSCGAKMVTIANKATHALYVYTPYTPNASALAAGWGAGNSCGAYGNRNFFLYFTSWFGSTHYTVTGAMRTAWTAAGGAGGVLGNPTGNAVKVTSSGGGSYQVFQHGRIYSSGAGTFALTGAIASRYVALKGPGSGLKWPTAAAVVTTANGGGAAQPFQGGLLAAATGATAYPVTGAVLAEYRARQAQSGSVGWPTSDAATVTGGVSQPFSRGVIVQKTGQSAHAVLADLAADYAANGGTGGPLGWPTAGWRGTTVNGGGESQAFEHGALYHSANGGFAVTGSLATAYAASGGPGGALSWPVAHGGAVQGGTKQTFVNGTLYEPAGKTVVPVISPFIAEYRRVGANGGPLGWPAAPKGPVTAPAGSVSPAAATVKGSMQQFQQGAIYGAPLGNFSVAGAVYSAYLQHGGPLGSLGWPARKLWTHTKNGGGVSQKFAGGYVFSSKAGSHAVGGSILATYLRRGGVGGTLGWPAGEGRRTTTRYGSGTVQTFQSGAVYSSSHGAMAVRGAILKAYLAKGGPASALGWPTSEAHASAGVTTQRFQHGTITWTAARGAAVHS